MQINHVKAFSVYLFSSIEINSALAKLLIYINNMNLACSADSVVFYQAKLKPACPATVAN